MSRSFGNSLASVFGMVWFFDRNNERVSCETRRTTAGYEVTISRPDGTADVLSLPTPRALIDGLLSISGELIEQEWRPSLAAAH